MTEAHPHTTRRGSVFTNGATNGDSGVASVHASSSLWDAVDELVDRTRRFSDLEGHGLHLLATRRRRRLGLDVSPEALRQERAAAILTLIAGGLLERIRASCRGPILLMKGPEIAARYPDPALRPFRDLDLLVPDAGAAQRELMAAGFEPAGRPELYVGIHHLRPLVWPGLPLLVEVHERPKWIEGVAQPATAEILASAVPAAVGVDGLLALPPAEHAVLVAVHAWAHVPLSRLIQLVDLAALAQAADRRDVTLVARRWGVERVWRASREAADAVLLGDRPPLSLRVWGRNLASVRERTVLESHLENLFAPWWALPPRQAARRTASAVGAELRPRPDETWRQKLRRTRLAFRDAFDRISDHDRALERLGVHAKGETNDEASPAGS